MKELALRIASLLWISEVCSTDPVNILLIDVGKRNRGIGVGIRSCKRIFLDAGKHDLCSGRCGGVCF